MKRQKDRGPVAREQTAADVRSSSTHSPIGLSQRLSASGNRDWLFGLGLLIVTLIAYQPAWNGAPLWDDDTFLWNNPLIKSSEGLKQFWFTTQAADYFPLTSTTLWLEWRLWGDHPLGYHLVNILLHAFSAVLLWRILVRLKIPMAWLAAAVFALHPVNVESVAWITQRKNTLAMFFYALTLLWYLTFEDTGRRRWYWLGLGAFLLALLSKTAVVMLPLVLLLIAWWRRRRITGKDVLLAAPFLVVALLLGFVTFAYQAHRALGEEIVRDDSFWSRLVVSGNAIWFYLYKALLPLNLSFVYPRWQIDPARFVSWIPGLLIVAALAVGWSCRRTWGRGWLFGLGYFVVMLAPVLGFANIYFMRYSLVADHWQYFSIIGAITLALAGVQKMFDALSGDSRSPTQIFAVVLLAVFGVLTWRQAGIYRDVETLWRDTLTKNPSCWLARNNLGSLLLHSGRLDDAIVELKEALKMAPDNPSAHNNLAGALAIRDGLTREVVNHYQEALRIDPNHLNAHRNLGVYLFQNDRPREASVHFERMLEIQPTNVVARIHLARILAAQGQAEGAIAHYEKILEMDPANVVALGGLSDLLVGKGRWSEAVGRLRTALEVQPDNAGLCNNLAWILASCPVASVRDGPRAVELGLTAERLSGGTNSVIVGTLAAAYAEAGRFSEATTTARRAMALAANPTQVNTLQSHISLYEAGRPFHQSDATNAIVQPVER